MKYILLLGMIFYWNCVSFAHEINNKSGRKKILYKHNHILIEKKSFILKHKNSLCLDLLNNKVQIPAKTKLYFKSKAIENIELPLANFPSNLKERINLERFENLNSIQYLGNNDSALCSIAAYEANVNYPSFQRTGISIFLLSITIPPIGYIAAITAYDSEPKLENLGILDDHLLNNPLYVSCYKKQAFKLKSKIVIKNLIGGIAASLSIITLNLLLK